MRHFSFLGDQAHDELFARAPEPFGARSDRELIGTALGAVLYSPATRDGVAQRLLHGYWPGLTTMVLCLEDSVGDAELPQAEATLELTLRDIHDALESGTVDRDDVPMLFVRVRDPEHLRAWNRKIGGLRDVLAGFVLPKFSTANAAEFLAATIDASERAWIMPILESGAVAHRETRIEELLGLQAALAPFRSRVPCVRIGATDLSGLYGLRRSMDMTIYDIAVVRDVIADIVNVLGRPEGGWTISGPVWEFFQADERMFKSRLREGAFEDESGDDGLRLRQELVNNALDGLMREVTFDQANGLQGKTIIHPSHIMPVNALGVVSQEEYEDAVQILDRVASGAGATGSTQGGKMNEPKPHQQWALKIMLRARAYGVLRHEHSYVGLLQAARDHAMAVTA